MAGDPINTSTGNKYLQEDDYLGSRWLAFRRFYNSHPSVASAAMGAHWRHSFDRTLELSNGGVDSNSIPLPPNTAVLRRPDGKQEVFSKLTGQWIAASIFPDVLVERDNAQGIATGYTVLIAASHHFETYDAAGALQSITDETGIGIALAYSNILTAPAIAPKPGLLLTVTDPTGRQLALTYDSSARVHQVTLPDSGTLVYAYDAVGNLASVQYPGSKTRQYTYNESTLTGGASLPNAMTGIVDEVGVRYENTTFDGTGRATSSSFAGNVGNTHITYNADSTSTVQYPLGITSKMTFSTIQGLVKVASADQACSPQCGQPWKTRLYDANGYPSSYTDFNGHITTKTFDATGLLTQNVEGSGTTDRRTTNITWDTALRNPLTQTTKDAQGNIVLKEAWTYNALGEAVARCEMDPAIPAAASYVCAAAGVAPQGVRRWTYSYCTAVDTTSCPIVGLLLSVDGPRTDVTDVTTYSYYMADSATARHGDLKTVTDALGHVTTYLSYDGAGRVAVVKDANGVFTNFAYTPRGWLASRTIRTTSDNSPSSTDSTTLITYKDFGSVASVTDPEGVVTSLTYDGAHRLTDVTDNQGAHVHYTLDAAGNKIKEETFDATSTVRRSLSRNFNTLGRLTAVVDGLSHTVLNAALSDSYDANGNLVHTADALGIERKRSYDALDRLVGTLDNYNGTDATTRNAQSISTFDALGRVVGVSDPSGLNTTYDVDALGNTDALHSPDSGTTTYVYDAAGNRIQATDARGIARTLSYDALNRVATVSYPDATQNATYHFDESNAVTGCPSSFPVGRLTRIVESSVSTVFCYDGRGNITRKLQTVGSATDTTTYAYTLGNRLAGIGYPSGNQASYGRDVNGRIQSVTLTPVGGSASIVASAVSYLPFGPVASYTLGNGQTVTRTYDANYRATDVTSPALNLHFAFDAMGDVTALGDAPGASPAVETYSYDPLYHLTGVTGASSEAYTYNASGDRLSKTGGISATGAYTYQTGSHRLASVGSAARTNDANGNTTGNVVAGEAIGLGYNDRNRMTVVQRGDQTVGTYVYNALGQRNSKVSTFPQSASVRYAYDEDGRLIGEYGASDRDYVWIDKLPIAVSDAATSSNLVAYVHVDAQGTPRAVVSATGSTLWKWSYAGNPFGEQQPTAIEYTLNLRFPGQYFDAESGLSDNAYRNYEPSIGRYVQSDPSGLQGGRNTFSYVSGNPLRHVDRFGLQEDDASEESKAERDALQAQFAPFIGPNQVPQSGYQEDLQDGECRSQGFRGSNGSPLNNAPFQPLRNDPATINGTNYSAHALDQMENRGYTPSVIENAIRTGEQYPTRDGTTGFYDPINNVRVIVNSTTGKVVTTIPGAPR
jgi:RHS repeat-associated protein